MVILFQVIESNILFILILDICFSGVSKVYRLVNSIEKYKYIVHFILKVINKSKHHYKCRYMCHE